MTAISHKKKIPHIGKAQKQKLKKASFEVVYADFDEIEPFLANYKVPKGGKEVFLLVIEKDTSNQNSLKSELKDLGFRTLSGDKKANKLFKTPVPRTMQGKVLNELQTLLSINQDDLSSIIGCSSRKIWSILNDREDFFKQKAQAKSFNEFVNLINLLHGLKENAELRNWFKSPQKPFSNQKPIDLLKNGEIERVFRWTYIQLEGSYK